ncbi:spore cortex biosynthesis protein YabQ [Acetivibrio cellulolyticus]|uniref:spore cortex biosynthesis protein YabQ n=1 Tax=Acetivibrio cellulolyticus TaxID=35830 RepID=UPI0002481B5B
MIIAFIYDVFRIRRKAIKSSNIIVYFEDFIYWILVSLVLFAVVYISNDGELRGYLLIGAVIGIILYSLLLSKIIMTVFLFTIRVVYKFFVTAFSIILFPFKIIFKILKVPAKIVYNSLGKVFGRARRLGKDNIGKFKIWKKRFKNIIKKI